MIVAEAPLPCLDRIRQQSFCFIPTALDTICPREVFHDGQCVWMIFTEKSSSRLHYSHLQCFCFSQTALVTVCPREVGHDGQRGWMAFTQKSSARLHYSHLQC